MKECLIPNIALSYVVPLAAQLQAVNYFLREAAALTK